MEVGPYSRQITVENRYIDLVTSKNAPRICVKPQQIKRPRTGCFGIRRALREDVERMATK